MGGAEFRLLGPVEVVVDGRAVPLGGVKQRALLALLVLRANEVVSRDLIVDALWGPRAPPGADHSLVVYVSRLRKALSAGGVDALATAGGGYIVRVDPRQTDVGRFERALEEGCRLLAVASAGEAAEVLRSALAEFRGDPLSDVVGVPFAEAEAGRLEELRLAALEGRIDADLALGRHTELVGELESLVARHQLNERLHGQLMLALYRSGRQAQALDAYRSVRRVLVEELGIEPGAELRQLEQAILRQDPMLEAPTPITPVGQTAAPSLPSVPAALPPRQRKTVSVLGASVLPSADSERVDPESFQLAADRRLAVIKQVVERHGGVIERPVGDTVVGVFGVPVAHEDDGLRAVRAATELCDALSGLGGVQIGVNTGEVVTGAQERLAVGDPVCVAERLQRAARPGEVLLGQATRALVADLVEVEQIEPPTLDEPLTAHRLLRVRDATRPRPEPPFVGRRDELALLRKAWERVQAGRRCELVTIVGEAGVGKSRLVAELLPTLDATVVRGRCLPYGEGITYWPVVEALKQLQVIPRDKVAAEAIRSLLGETEAPSAADEIAWAVRKTLEQAAAERPTVVVFDDIHHAEQTFLDLIEHVALLSTAAPILLLCMARPELSERQPDWPVALQLEPLANEEVERLIPEQISGALRKRIADASGGNPLFIAEMLAITDKTTGTVTVPPTLHALLAARLDQLDAAERDLLQCGAIEGEIFHRGAVQALAPEETRLSHHLTTLTRKGLIRLESSQLPGEDSFRFSHLLMRDTAYDSLPKTLRADLHERFAAWLQQRATNLVDLDQILGHHLEQAVRYRDELGLPDDAELRGAARQRLTAAGHRAYLGQDYAAAARLLERAATLIPEGAFDLGLELELFDTLLWAGRGDDAIRSARALAGRAIAAGNRVAEFCGRIHEGIAMIWLEPEGAANRLAVRVEQALPALEAAGDEIALCLAHQGLAQALQGKAGLDRAVGAWERAADHAMRAGLDNRFVRWRDLARFHGSTPLSELLAWQDGLEERDRRDWNVRQDRAWATAMLGRVDEARAQLAELRADLAERGARLPLGGVDAEAGAGIELLAGDPEAAATLLEKSYRLGVEVGQHGSAWTYAGWVALACCELGRLDEADAWAGRAAAADASDDALTQMLWRQARAKVLARRGRHREAEGLAREAVAIGERVEALNWCADAYADLGEVLLLAGREREAAEVLEQALERYERKENLVMAERTRARLAKLAAQPLS